MRGDPLATRPNYTPVISRPAFIVYERPSVTLADFLPADEG